MADDHLTAEPGSSGSLGSAEAGGGPDIAAGSGTLLAGGSDERFGSVSGSDARSATAVPDQYDLQAPEGAAWTDEQMTAFHGQARDLGLSQTQAQKLLEAAHGNQRQVLEQHQRQVESWAEELRLDRDLGGAKFEATVMQARAGLKAFDTDGSIGAMLQETGYGNHPSVVRLFQRIGRALGEDTLATGSGTRGDAPLEDRLFKNMQL